ncbi:MAG: sigma-70 family RNA polymerase sigma factor [Verrucomicrobiota bacterium]
MSDESRSAEVWQSWLAEHSAKWLFFARQQTRSEADAEDALQDALVKTWKTCKGKITEETSSLVYTNIRRCAIDRARSNIRREEREQTVAEETPQTEEAWFQTSGDDQVFAQAIQVALGKIPEKYREVVTLKIWGELTFAQIAEQLGEKPNTVASRYRYGLENLRKILADQKEMVGESS